MDAGLLARAVNMLEEVDMEVKDTMLSVGQVEEILTHSLVKISLLTEASVHRLG